MTAAMAIKAGAKAAARALLVASPSSQSEDEQQRVIDWLKISALPLVVFLIGACIWGCIKNSTVWKMLTEEDGGSTRTERVEVPRADPPQPIDRNNDDAVQLTICRQDGSPDTGAADAHVDGRVGETTSDSETSPGTRNDESRVNEDSSA